nr:hypothetical protein [Tepidiforma thermophila]
MRAVFVMIKTDPGTPRPSPTVSPKCPPSPSATASPASTTSWPKLYVDDIDSIGRVIERDIHAIPHVRETYTILTFEAFGVR